VHLWCSEQNTPNLEPLTPSKQITHCLGWQRGKNYKRKIWTSRPENTGKQDHGSNWMSIFAIWFQGRAGCRVLAIPSECRLWLTGAGVQEPLVTIISFDSVASWFMYEVLCDRVLFQAANMFCLIGIMFFSHYIMQAGPKVCRKC